MRIGNTKTMATAAVALGLGFSSISSAQDLDLKIPVKLSYTSSNMVSTKKDTWNTVMLVSGILLVAGLVTSESTLVILGGIGVIVSLVQLNQSNYHYQSMPHGVDMLRSGPVAFGVSPFSKLGFTDKNTPFRPSAYITANFKF